MYCKPFLAGENTSVLNMLPTTVNIYVYNMHHMTKHVLSFSNTSVLNSSHYNAKNVSNVSILESFQKVTFSLTKTPSLCRRKAKTIRKICFQTNKLISNCKDAYAAHATWYCCSVQNIMHLVSDLVWVPNALFLNYNCFVLDCTSLISCMACDI